MHALDAIDRKILSQLQSDSRTTMQELGFQFGLSVSPCHRRVKQGETDRPTLSASSCMVVRLSDCSRLRILRSMASSVRIGINSGWGARNWEFIPIYRGMSRKFEIFGEGRSANIAMNHCAWEYRHGDRTRT